MSEILLVGTMKPSGAPVQKLAGSANAAGHFATLMADDLVTGSPDPETDVLADMTLDANVQEKLPSETTDSVDKEEDPESILAEGQVAVDDLATVSAPLHFVVGRPEENVEKASSDAEQSLTSAAAPVFSKRDGKYPVMFQQPSLPWGDDRAGTTAGRALEAGDNTPTRLGASPLVGGSLFSMKEMLNSADLIAERAGTDMDVGLTALEVVDNGVRFTDSPGRLTSQPVQAGPLRIEVLRHIAQAFVTAQDNQVEIALSPEELGKLQLTVRRDEMGAHIFVWAERPETLDLIRRHAGLLMQEFHDQGISDAEFSFGSGGAGSGAPEQRDGRKLPDTPLAAPLEAGSDLMIQPPRYRIMRSGLDIRV